MRILFLGDVVAEHGREAVRDVVPKLIEEFAPDFIVLNGENVAGGNGITPKLAYDLFRAKVDVITLGDHVWDQREIFSFFAEEPRLIRPFNFPSTCPGKGWIIVNGNGKKLGVVNAMGRTFMKTDVDNPFLLMDPRVPSPRTRLTSKSRLTAPARLQRRIFCIKKTWWKPGLGSSFAESRIGITFRKRERP